MDDGEEDGDVLDQVVVRAAVDQLRGLLAAVEAGEVDATAEELAHVRGAVEALERVVTG